MTESRLRLKREGIVLWLAFASLCAAAFQLPTEGARTHASSSLSALGRRGTQERLEIRLRSFMGGASGRLSIDPTPDGGRARLTALGLPAPELLAPSARTFVVWAVSDGRIVRIGELQHDGRGNGGLEFAHPAAFERYTVVVTAEASAEAERPGAPVLSSRAGEARALFAAKEAPSGGEAREKSSLAADVKPATGVRPRRLAGDFYTEVDDALEAQGGGRALLLFGDEATPAARGDARATAQTGTAFIRARFKDLPLPSAVGANTYVLWGARPDGRIFYMGSLPVTEDLNRMEIYVRVGGVGSDDYDLFVTAERQRPASLPSERRVLSVRGEREPVR